MNEQKQDRELNAEELEQVTGGAKRQTLYGDDNDHGNRKRGALDNDPSGVKRRQTDLGSER